MKSTLFELKKSDINCVMNPDSSSSYPYLWYHHIPILPAYSVEYFKGEVGGTSALSTSEDRIDGGDAIMTSMFNLDGIEENEKIIIVLYYHGIREYSSLFPWITVPKLKERLGLFYEEAEKNFDQGAWLSFALMCGAVFEGILYAKFFMSNGRKKFGEMISDAYSDGLITTNQYNILAKVRNLRNMVHGNQFRNPYVTRKDAMDIRKTLDQLIKEFSY